MSLVPYLHQAADGKHLSPEEAHRAMAIILSGGASTPLIAAFLVALRMKGETSGELLGFARAMREVSERVDACAGGEPLLDTCGTGGDGKGTFNISTVTAFVVAGAGVRVAKHGNRSISSSCGSADVLERLGIDIALDAGRAARAIAEVGIGFLFAPAFHPAMRHAQPARVELKMRTVFNILGPLTNPAGATAQLVGASSDEAAALIADTLASLGLCRGFVVHGSDGLDEITTTGPTLVFEIRAGRVTRRAFHPEDFGVPGARAADLRGGVPEVNAALASAVLSGERGPRRDIVLVNSAAALMAGGKAETLAEGMKIAAESIDSGAAKRKVEELAAFGRRAG